MAETLQTWVQQGTVAQAQLSSDGQSLSLGETNLDASQAVELTHQDKSCRYTLASLFLQIKDPSQGLVAYRGACKAHSVKDPVKALDKPLVLGYYNVGSSGAAAAVPADTAVAAPAAAEQTPKAKDRRSSSSADRHKDHKKRSKHDKKHDKRKDKSSSKRPRSSSEGDSHKKTKKTKAPMTNEQLFSNLNVVVDKRTATAPTSIASTTAAPDEANQIHQALSADGFEVTPALLQEYQEKLESILPLEIPVGNSASILRPTTLGGRDFQRVLDLYLETTGTKSKSSKSSSNMPKSPSQQQQQKSYLIGKKPVIVVPKGMTSPITMGNAMDFFGQAKFVPRSNIASRKPSSGANFLTRKISSRLGGGLLEYEVMDNPKAKLGEDPKEWQRIVAVISNGASWQFKDWPGQYKHAVHLFSRTFGFYISMEGDIVPKELEGWAVKRGNLNRDKRGLDSVTYASFWNGLDEWMAIHKKELLPQQQQQQ